MNYVSEFEVTAEAHASFFKRARKSIKKLCIVIGIVWFVFFAIWLADLIAESVTGEPFLEDGSAIVFVAWLFMLIFGLFLFILLKSGKQAYQKTAERGGEIVNFSFNEQYFVFQNVYKGTEFGNTLRGNYFFLTLVEEYDDMWIFNYDGALLFYLMKGRAQEGTDEELAAHLKSVTGNKYKVVPNKKKGK